MSIAFLLPWRGIEPFAVPHVTQNQRFVRSGFAVSSLPVSVAAVKAFRVARKLRTGVLGDYMVLCHLARFVPFANFTALEAQDKETMTGWDPIKYPPEGFSELL